MTYSSLEDIASAFYQASTVETKSLFLQGQIILDAVGQGFDVDETTAICASHVRRTKRTIYRRYSVARTFVLPHPALEGNWELHAQCADLVDYRQKDEQAILQQQQAAQAWLDMAAAEQWSTRQLRAAMIANGDDPDKGKPEVLINNAEAVVMNPLFGGHRLDLHFVEEFDFEIPVGAAVIVSIVKAPTQEGVTP